MLNMLSFSTENPLKTATLQNLDRFLLQSKILSVTKINVHMPISQIDINKKITPYILSTKEILMK